MGDDRECVRLGGEGKVDQVSRWVEGGAKTEEVMEGEGAVMGGGGSWWRHVARAGEGDDGK